MAGTARKCLGQFGFFVFGSISGVKHLGTVIARLFGQNAEADGETTEELSDDSNRKRFIRLDLRLVTDCSLRRA
jgi:hypothetical protein